MLWVVKVIAAGQPWAPAAGSGVLIAAAIPAAALGPFCGVFIDRWDRTRTMLTADAARAVLIALLVPLGFGPVAAHVPRAAQLGLVYLLVGAAACVSQFFGPAQVALLGAIVTKDQLPRAAAIVQSMSSGAAIIGPPLAAPLFFAAGPGWALAIDALSFAVSFTTIRLIRHPGAPAPAEAPSGQQGYWQEFRAGVRFAAASPVIVAVATGIVVATLGSGALSTLDVFFLQANLHASASLYGTLGMALAIGMIAGALAAGRIANRAGTATLFWAGLVLSGAALTGYSRMTSLPPALAFLAAAGVALGAVNAAVAPLMLGATPQHLIGRVESVLSPLISLASVSSIAAAGFLASTGLRSFHTALAGISFGPYDSIFAIAGLLFTVSGLAAIAPLHRPMPPRTEFPAAQPDPR